MQPKIYSFQIIYTGSKILTSFQIFFSGPKEFVVTRCQIRAIGRVFQNFLLKLTQDWPSLAVCGVALSPVPLVSCGGRPIVVRSQSGNTVQLSQWCCREEIFNVIHHCSSLSYTQMIPKHSEHGFLGRRCCLELLWWRGTASLFGFRYPKCYDGESSACCRCCSFAVLIMLNEVAQSSTVAGGICVPQQWWHSAR